MSGVKISNQSVRGIGLIIEHAFLFKEKLCGTLRKNMRKNWKYLICINPLFHLSFSFRLLYFNYYFSITMSKLLVIFGVTGQQGGSVAEYVMNDPELSNIYKVRGITRDSSKPSAQALQQKGVELVTADMADKESVKLALKGADTVFAMTSATYELISKQERTQGKRLVDAAVEENVKYFIWSTLPHVEKISEGKILGVLHFDEKAEVEEYLRSKPIKSAFFSPAMFMQNFNLDFSPRPLGDGTYGIFNIINPDRKVALLDIVGDSGKFVGGILANPDMYEGKVISAAANTYTMEEVAQTMSEVTGKTVKYNKISEEVYRGFLPPQAADDLVSMFKHMNDNGYFGPQMEDLVKSGIKQARGNVTTLKEYFTKNPPKFE